MELHQAAHSILKEAMVFNEKLYKGIREAGLKQKNFAAKVGVDPSIVSRVISGIWNLTPAEQTCWARALRKRTKDLFGGNDP
jgi:predicted transcriptional regulator